jgi:hypothetical protein
MTLDLAPRIDQNAKIISQDASGHALAKMPVPRLRDEPRQGACRRGGVGHQYQPLACQLFQASHGVPYRLPM